MPSHEHYLELGALAAIGQISVEEDRELMQHLSECHECRGAYSDYSAILHNHLPNASPVRFRLKKEFVHSAAGNEVRERFLARARSEGAEFSPEVEAHRQENRAPQWSMGSRRLAWAAAASAMGVMALAWMVIYRARLSEHDELASLLRQNEMLSHQLVAARQVPTKTVYVQRGDEQRLVELQPQTQVLRRELNQSAERVKALEGQLEELQGQNLSLSSTHQRDQAGIQELQKQLAHEKDGSAATIAALVEAQNRLKELNSTVSENSQRLAMDQQLNAVSSDVRQLMGARNLHIIDVHDVSASGKSAKSFGRVFYSEGQSLVFYAFDLPAKVAPAKYFFKAWGQMEAKERSVHDLGVFSVDDRGQRRWVLKVSDPRLLNGIDSVFVTAEATQDSIVPKGKRVLYAYLAGAPNHP